MKIEDFREIFNNYLEDLNIKLSEEQVEKFYRYMNLLIEWNEKINLTAIVKPEEIILKHFVDCLTVEKYIEKNSKVIDVGTGAGFPGIPLKIIREDLEITLVDSLNKRLVFLNEIIINLNLNKIHIIHSRAEELGKDKNYREKFDVATSRAVANLSTLSEYLIPFVKIGGKCIVMKSADIDKEIEKAKKAIKILGGKIVSKDIFNLPKSNLGRSVIMIQKIGNTPKNFPRKPGTPAKEPIL